MNKSANLHHSPILLILYAILAFFTIACKKEADKKLIIGHWTGTEWLVEGQPSTHTPEAAVFTFDDTGHYTFTYNDNIEKGDYYVNNDQLFTTPEGGIKMMVKIPKLTRDTLIFDMNRGGQAERLKLVRKN
jgi:hypothetical protein